MLTRTQRQQIEANQAAREKTIRLLAVLGTLISLAAIWSP